jgi:methyl-accepting chemotaxis protein
MTLPRISLRWKIFGMFFNLTVAILVTNYFYMRIVAHRTMVNSGQVMKGVHRRYEVYQKSMAQGMTAAVDVMATQTRLQEAFARGDDEQTRPILASIEQMLAHSIQPDFVILVDRHGDAYRSKDSPIDALDVSAMRVVADMRQGMSIDNMVLEYKRRAYLVAGEPVKKDHEVVGAILIGRRIEKLFAEFRAQTDDDPKKQIHLALVHNQETTASSAPLDEWDDIARASRPESRETADDGRTSIVNLPSGKHEFFSAQINGYDGSAIGGLGSVLVLRNRLDKQLQIDEINRDSLVISVVALIIASLFGMGATVWLMRPLKRFIAATHDLAHGKGDLTKRLDIRTRTIELDQLATNLNAVFTSLHKLASEVQVASLQVGASSAEISAASKQMLSGASDQATKIESSTAAVTELSSSIQQMAENASQAGRVAKESGDTLAQNIGLLGRTSILIEETSTKIAALGQSGKRIGNIVEVIRQISEQTSLLALNASIEAAHAGEQGRGFAVVADEVSSLARRVGQSAKDIEGLIATISEQTVEAVTSMQNVTRAFTEHTSGTGVMQIALRQIVEVVQDTARSVHEQAVVSDEIARNMDAVQKIAHEVLDSSEEAVVQGEQLHTLALRLEQLVRGFRTDRDGDDDGSDDADLATTRALSRGGTAALPERSSERRKVAR